MEQVQQEIEIEKAKPTEFWARKMRKVFRALDVEKKGYISEASLEEIFSKFSDRYPEIEKARIKASYQHTWNILYNCGDPVPPDYRLSEEQFVKNMWRSVNKPSFMDEVIKISRDIMDRMDLKHKGYITKEEYVAMNKHQSEEHATSIFNAMDHGKGKISFEDLVQAKFFYYTDVSDESHPLNYFQGSLDDCGPRYTEFWARKMRKVFRTIDTEKRGYITRAMLDEQSAHVKKGFPKVEQESLEKTYDRTWHVLFNCGRHVPKDYRLTEEQFVKNMWYSVNQPSFKDEVKESTLAVFNQMDLEHKGHITKDEYLKLTNKFHGEDKATAIFNTMDKNSQGKIEFSDLLDAKFFYYTDVSDESHPFNQIQGPLDDCESQPTDLWKRKMRKVFSMLDSEKNGYLTLAGMTKFIDEAGAGNHPIQSVQKDTLKALHHHTWHALYNAGQEVPQDHKLTEDQFIKNMWVSVNRPYFRDEIVAMGRESFQQMDLKHKGYITMEEYLAIYSKHHGEEHATSIFKAMDHGRGKVRFEDLLQAKFFYYTDTSDESHPLNQIYGPLD